MEALRLSIPRMLEQSSPPSQLIVIDSSDDHESVVTAVREAVGDSQVDLIVSPGRRGASAQRNHGLESVRCPVVIFPDDDSIWFPGVAAEIMSVYEHDTECRFSAVCGAESHEPPPGFLEEARGKYQMRFKERLKQRLGHHRARIEKALFPDPAHIIGQSYFSRCPVTDWMKENNVVPVEWMTGFRMSFRTEVIREFGFPEDMGHYSIIEDIDASFNAWKRGAVVAARNAQVFHYKSPERRAGGKRLGVMQILNKAFVVAKFTPPGDPARAAMRRFARYKVLQYSVGGRDAFGKERFSGARAALDVVGPILEASSDEVPAIYQEVVAQCLPGGE